MYALLQIFEQLRATYGQMLENKLQVQETVDEASEEALSDGQDKSQRRV